jgi:hypothetical protein
MAAGTSSAVTPALSKFALAAKTAVISHSGVISKLTATAIPKAIAALTSSLGGMTALQAEVLSILSSPLTPSSLRARGMHILSGLRRAHAADKARTQAEREEDERAALEMEQQAEREEREGKDVTDEKTGEVRSVGVTEGSGVRGRSYVRKHGVYIGARKHYEVRVVRPAGQDVVCWLIGTFRRNRFACRACLSASGSRQRILSSHEAARDYDDPLPTTIPINDALVSLL